MADVLDRKQRRPAPPLRDPRETLEPLLDELMRSHGFERAVVLLYDEERAALAGSCGIGVPDEIARELVIAVAQPDDPIVVALRGGLPQRIPDAIRDARISAAARETLARARLGPIVAAPLRSTAERSPAGPDGNAISPPGSERRGEAARGGLSSRPCGGGQSGRYWRVPS